MKLRASTQTPGGGFSEQLDKAMVDAIAGIRKTSKTKPDPIPSAPPVTAPGPDATEPDRQYEEDQVQDEDEDDDQDAGVEEQRTSPVRGRRIHVRRTDFADRGRTAQPDAGRRQVHGGRCVPYPPRDRPIPVKN
jgi:hypothetical protein